MGLGCKTLWFLCFECIKILSSTRDFGRFLSELENEGVLSLDIRELRYIIGIADARNMTKAASNLFVTQPALSKMLKKVEEQLGTQLFVRDGNSMTPTMRDCTWWSAAKR